MGVLALTATEHRGVVTAAIVAAALALSFLAARVAVRRRAGIAFGLFGAGLAFALQEVLGAIAGWFNILLGGIYRVGDRIELAGVHGDVIDVTPLRTKLLETGVADPPPVGAPAATDYWVRGRQPTGRVVAISNKATFTSPVFNYSGAFGYVWQELVVPISYRSDWREAERILLDEARRASATEGAREAMEAMRQRYPLPQTELEPRVFVRATDNWMELSARFVVPVRQSRVALNDVYRRLRDRLDESGIEISSTTAEVTVRVPGNGQEPGER